MVGRCIPYWNSPFLVDMLVLGGVSLWFFFRVVLLFHTTTRDTNVQIQIDNECLQFLSHVFQIKSFRPLTPDFTQTIWSFNLFAISHLPPPKKKIISPQKKGTNPVGPTQNPSRFFLVSKFSSVLSTTFFPPFRRRAKLLFKIRILSNFLDAVAAAMSKAKAFRRCTGSNGSGIGEVLPIDLFWVALGMLMHFALTMLWRLAKAGFRPRLRVHSLKANGGHVASIRS